MSHSMSELAEIKPEKSTGVVLARGLKKSFSGSQCSQSSDRRPAQDWHPCAVRDHRRRPSDAYAQADYGGIHQELRCKDMTLALLWEEYSESGMPHWWPHSGQWSHVYADEWRRPYFGQSVR